jgi:hypothetical protein
MPIDIVSNGALSYLRQINKKQKTDEFFPHTDDPFGVGPAYIVEISAKGRQLQQANPVKIARL